MSALPDLTQLEREELLRAGHHLSEHAPAALLLQLLDWTAWGAREVSDLARLAPAAEIWMRAVQELEPVLPLPVFRALVALVLQLLLCERLPGCAPAGEGYEAGLVRGWCVRERRERLLEAIAGAAAAVRLWARNEL